MFIVPPITFMKFVYLLIYTYYICNMANKKPYKYGITTKVKLQAKHTNFAIFSGY